MPYRRSAASRAMPQTAPNQDWQDWFGRVWAYREKVLYPSLFGHNSRGIFPIQAEMLLDLFKQKTFDPRWLHYGVFEFAPAPTRNSWLYVTSGMSNDWDAGQPDPTTPSGLGCEFIFETPQQAEWAILRLLHLMTFQILLCHGRYPGRQPMSDFDRVPLRGPICFEDSCSAISWPRRLHDFLARHSWIPGRLISIRLSASAGPRLPSLVRTVVQHC